MRGLGRAKGRLCPEGQNSQPSAVWASRVTIITTTTIIIIRLNGICCQKLSVETVKQPAVSSENPSRCPTEEKIP